MKRLFSIAMSLMIVFAFSITSFASERDVTDPTKSNFEKYVKEGVLGSDVSYEEWKQLVEESRKLEEKLSKSDEFYEVYSSEKISDSKAGFSLQRGDIIITNGTSSAGILGHAGIATSSSYILHIAGKGSHPAKISLSKWHKKYTNKGTDTWSKVYRHKTKTNAKAAATWAENTYLGSGATYKITGNLASTSVTYCSKIVWQAYYYGPSSHQANGPTVGYRMPYDLPNTVWSVSLKCTYRPA